MSRTLPASTMRPAYITGDAVAHLGDHAEVVGDEDDGQPALGLNLLQQGEILGLDGGVSEVVGSSAMSTCGWQARAMAPATR